MPKRAGGMRRSQRALQHASSCFALAATAVQAADTRTGGGGGALLVVVVLASSEVGRSFAGVLSPGIAASGRE